MPIGLRVCIKRDFNCDKIFFVQPLLTGTNGRRLNIRATLTVCVKLTSP